MVPADGAPLPAPTALLVAITGYGQRADVLCCKEAGIDETVEVRFIRMLGPTEAKVVLVSNGADALGNPAPQNDEVFTIFLVYYDGAWSVTRCDASWSVAKDFNNRAIRFLMLAIDEAAEK